MSIKHILILILGLLISTLQDATAGHSRGGELTYTCVGPNQYVVTLTVYRDCNGINFPASESVNWTSSPLCGSGSFIVNRTNIEDITPLCSTLSSSCGGGGGVGVERHTYVGTLVVPPGCNSIIMSYRVCCRNNAITTLNNPGGESLYIETIVDNMAVPCNSSPTFSNPPMEYGCVNQQIIYNNGAADPDGDSLAYSLVDCRDNAFNPVIYAAGGFDGQNPFGTSDPITLDPLTGTISFTPSVNHVGVVCMLIEEYRGGIKVGEVYRDMQFQVFACSNQTPVLTGVNGATGGGTGDYVTSVCSGVPFCFDVFGSDANPVDSIFMTYNNGIPAGNFQVYPNGGANQLKGTFCWTPTASDIGEHKFKVKLEDNACPFNTTRILTYTINVVPSLDAPVNAGPNVDICLGDNTVLNATTTSSNGVSYEWSPSAGLSNPNVPNPVASPTITTAYTVTLTYLSGCTSVDNVTVHVHDVPAVGITPNNINVCGGAPVAVLGTTDRVNQVFSWTDMNTAAVGYPKFPAGTSGAVSGASSQLLFNMYNDPGIYVFQLEVTDPITGCSDVEILTLTVGVQPPLTCANIYVSAVNGLPNNPGTQANPTTLKEAVKRAACNNTVIKMATGNYFIDSTINLSSYVTLEGGFLENNNWIKTSKQGETEIIRNNINPIGVQNVNRRVVALQAINASHFRLQDLTISCVDMPITSGWTSYGLYLNNVSDYHITRCQIVAGNGGNGFMGAPGCGRGSVAPGLDPLDGKAGETGAMGALLQNQDIPGGDGGRGGGNGVCGLTSATVPLGGQGGDMNDNGFGIGNGSDGGFATGGIVQGGAGGGGGRGALSQTLSEVGGNGGQGSAGGAPFGFAVGCAAEPSGLEPSANGGVGGIGGSTNGALLPGSPGTIGLPGLAGTLGCVGTPGGNGFHAGGFFNNGIQGGPGESGSAGSGGGGGGGGGGKLLTGTGNGGGGGGGGGAGAAGGQGGFGGGGSFGIYIANNGTNGYIEHCNVFAAGPGLGGAGGPGGVGGDGGPGGIGGSFGLTSIGRGGDGGNGGRGGDGGPGGNGQIGYAQNIFWDGLGAIPVARDSIFLFNIQNVIHVDNVNCTNTNVRFIDSLFALPGISVTNWNFDFVGSNSIPSTSSDNPGGTQYTAVGRYTIQHGAAAPPYDQYLGFHNIAMAGAAAPNILSTANVIGPDTFQLCVGAYAGFASTDAGDTIHWNFHGALSPNPGNQQIISGAQFVTAGFFLVELYISNDCCGDTDRDSVWLYVDPVPMVTGPIADSICAGGSTIIALSGLSSTDTVSWSPMSGLVQISPDSVIVSPGSTTTYTATVASKISSNGQTRYACPVFVDTEIHVTASISTNITAPPITCAGGTTNITVGASGGGGPLTYSWSGGNSGTFSTSSDVVGPAIPGNYDVTVSDGMGCDAFTSIVINAVAPVTATISSQNNVACHGDATGDATVQGAGGNGGPFTFIWDATTGGQTTATATGLLSGVYCVTVNDVLGCGNAICVTITEPANALTASPSVLSNYSGFDVSCFGLNDGQATVSGNGGTPFNPLTYTYQWDAATGNQTNQIATALSAGIYYVVTVTDSLGCIAVDSVILNEPAALGINIGPITNVDCKGDSNGTAYVEAFGGAGGLSYLWDAAAGNQTTQLATGLSAGTYCVDVIDINGCMTTVCPTITEPATFVAIALIGSTDASCNGFNDGTAFATGAGGTPSVLNGHSYLWAPSGQTTSAIVGLSAGWHFVTVTDSLGCIGIDSIVVGEPPAVNASVVSFIDILCFGDSTGEILVNGTGGSGGPYMYQWGANTGNQITANAIGLKAGISYCVTISDGTGCFDSICHILTEPANAISVIADTIMSYNGQAISCVGAADAQIGAIATGGTVVGAYSYSWDVPAFTQTVTNVGPGTYTVTASDDNGCEATDVLVVVNPSAITVSFNNIQHNTCFGDSIGSATVNPSGGTGNYTYLWSNGQTDITATGLKTANNPHIVTITDDNGCQGSDFININQGAPLPTPDIRAVDTTVCVGSTINFFSFTGGYTYYHWTGPNGWTSQIRAATILTATTSDSGQYTMYIEDANGCISADTTMNVHVFATPTPTIAGGTDVCFGERVILTNSPACDSAVWVDVVNGNILQGNNDSLIIPPFTTEYRTTVWQMECHNTTTGCSALSNMLFVNILPSPPQPNITNSGPICAGDSVLLFAPNVVNATSEWFRDSALTFSLGISDTLIVYDLLTDSTFYLVQTVNGCASPVGSETITVNPLPSTPDVPADFEVCEGDSIVLTTAHTGPNYFWSHPGGWVSNQQNPVIFPSNVLDSGLYTLFVVDGNGCQSPDTSVYVTIHSIPVAPLSGSLFNPICDGDTLTLGAVAGCDLYEWISPLGNSTIAGQVIDVAPNSADYVPGVWELICIDTITGCRSLPSVVDTIVIQPRPPFPAVSNSGPVCVGDSIVFTAAPIFGANYAWVEFDTTLITAGNPATIYNITSDTAFVLIVGINGCTVFDTVFAQAYPASQAPIPPPDMTVCDGDSVFFSTPTPASFYTWYHPSSSVDNSPNPAFVASGFDNGIYTLEIIDTNGCLAPDTTFSLTVNNPPPPPIVVSNSPICEGDTIFLAINGASCPQYEWTGASGVSFIAGDSLVIPFGHPDYGSNWTVACVDSFIGCSSAASVHTVNIKPIPPMPFVFNNGPVCVGDSVQLSTPIFAGANHTWYAMDSMTVIGTGNMVYAQNITTDTAFLLVVEVNGCENSDSTQVRVHTQLPQPAVPDSFAVCEDDTIFLTTITNAPFYSWTGPSGFVSNNQNPIRFPAKAAHTGFYTLNTVDSNGCPSMDTAVHVTVNPLPSPPSIFSPDNNFCDGDSLVLIRTSAPCDSMSWISPIGTYLAGTDTLGIEPPNSEYLGGDWFLLCVDTMTGCQALSNPVTIVIKPIPAPPILTQNGPVCFGDSAQLSMALVAGASYQWFAPDSSFLGNGPTLTVYNLTSDTAFYGVVIENGCSAFDSIHILVNPLPSVPNIGAVSDTVCASDSIQLTTSTLAAMYHWSGPNGFSSNDQNPVITGISPSNSGVYQLFVTDANGCNSFDTSIVIEVFFNPLQPSIASLSDICEGDTLSLEGPGCHISIWESPLGNIYNTSNGVYLDISPGTTDYVSGAWTVICVDTVIGCSSPPSDSFNITIHPYPIPISPTNDGPICYNESVTLSVPAQAFVSYLWSTDSLFTDNLGTGTVVVVDSITSDTTFYIQVTSSAGCTAWDSTHVLLNPPVPTPDISVLDSIVCEGDSIVFSTSTIASAYYWTGTNGFASSQQSFVIPTATVADAATYTLVVEDANGCLSPDTSITVTVNTTPYSGLTIFTGDVCYGDSIIVGTGGTVCDSFSWVGPQQAQGPSPYSLNEIYIYPGDANYMSGSWYLLCYDTITGCFAKSNTASLTVKPLPQMPIATNSGPICFGDSVDLSAAFAVAANTSWYTDTLAGAIGLGFNISVGPITSDTVFYVKQVVNSCSSPFASTLVTLHAPSSPPNISDSIFVCEGDDFTLTTTTNGDSYLWTGPGFSSTQQNPVITNATNTTAGLYTLTMIDSNGCLAPDTSVWVTVNTAPFAPTIFQSAPTCEGDSLYLGISGTCDQSIWTGPTGVPIISTNTYLAIAPNHPDYQDGDWDMLCVDTLTGCFALSNPITVTIDQIPSTVPITSSGPVCLGDSVDISIPAIPGVSTYTWMNIDTVVVGVGTNITIPDIISDTTIYLVITNASGCTYLLDSIDVLVSPQFPAPPIQSNAPICEGETLQLSTIFANGYNWSGPNGFSSNVQNPIISFTTMADSGLYTLSIIDGNGCLSLDSTANIIIHSLPLSPTAFGPGAICDGDTLFLTSTATGCDSAVWIGPSGNIVSGANLTIPSSSPDYLAGSWEVFCIDTVSGCQRGSNIVNVTINPLPNPVVINNGPVCIGDPVTLSTGLVLGSSYHWSSDSLMSDTLGTGFFTIVTNITSDSTFYLVTTPFNGCASAPIPTTVLIHTPAAAPNVGASFTVCEGDDIVLTTSTTASGYNWDGPNGFSSNQQNPVIVNASFADTGTYTLSVIDANGCESLDSSLYVNVDSLPVSPVIPFFGFLCQGDTLFLNADSTSNHCDSVEWVGPNGLSYTIPGRNVFVLPSDTNYVGGLWYMRCIDTTTGCASNSNLSIILISPLPDTQATYSNSPVCIGGDVTLSTPAPGVFVTYTWYADSNLTVVAATGQNPTISNITTDTTFYLVLTNGVGCNSMPMPTPVTVLPPGPAPNVPADFSVCEGEPIVMTTTTIATAYYWSATNGFMDSTQNPIVSNMATISDSGTYSLYVIDSNGCVSSDTSLYVTVNVLGPSPTISYNGPICHGDTLFFTSSGTCGQSQWIGPNGNSPATLGSPGPGNVLWVLGSSTGIPPGNQNYLGGDWYSVCIDTMTGCRSISDTITVVIDPIPVIAATLNSGPICIGDTVNLNVTATTGGASGALTITWYDDPSFTAASQIGIGSSIDVSNITSNSTFYVNVENGSGCNVIDSTTVVVHPLPLTPAVPANIVLCEGDALVLSSSTTASSYNWSGPNGFSSTQQNPAAIITNLSDSGFYVLNVIDANGCQSPDSMVHVTINALPLAPSVTNNGPVCIGDSINLSATLIAGVTYEWFKAPLGISVGTGQNLTLMNVTLADTGAYYVVVTANGCTRTSIDSTLVSVLGVGTATAFAGFDQVLCGQDSTIMSAAPSGNASIIGTWTTSSGATINGINNPVASITNLSVGNNVFYWTLSNSNCFNATVDSVIITVNPVSTDTAQAGGDQNLCGVTVTNLTGNTPLGANVTGTWTQSPSQASAGILINNPSSGTSTVSGLMPGNAYTFILSFANGSCGVYSTDTVVIDVDIAPSDNAFAGVNIIACGQDTVALSAFNSQYSGLWTTPSGAQILDSTQYNSLVTDLLQDTTIFIWTLSNGICTNFSTDTVLVIRSGASPIGNADSFAVVAGTTTTINVLPNDNLTSNWDIYINTSIANGQLFNLNNGLFDVILQVADTMNQTFIYELCNPTCPNSCDTALVILTVSSLGNCNPPNIFTPNGDGVNDEFIIPCLNNGEEAWMIVFNRWGDEVYQSDKYGNQWDGTHNNQPLPDGTYFYILRIGNGEELQGSVEIRR